MRDDDDCKLTMNERRGERKQGGILGYGAYHHGWVEWGSHKKYLSEGVTLEFKGRTENRFHPALNTLFDRSPEAEGAHERICQKNNF